MGKRLFLVIFTVLILNGSAAMAWTGKCGEGYKDAENGRCVPTDMPTDAVACDPGYFFDVRQNKCVFVSLPKKDLKRWPAADECRWGYHRGAYGGNCTPDQVPPYRPRVDPYFQGSDRYDTGYRR